MAPMTHVLQSMSDKEPFVTEPPICIIQKGQTLNQTHLLDQLLQNYSGILPLEGQRKTRHFGALCVE